jgi:hypothetical protein
MQLNNIFYLQSLLDSMAETLGSLCDKLTIIKLKQWHFEDEIRLNSLALQEKQLQEEINEFVNAAISGKIPREKLTFASNKVYKEESNLVPDVTGSIGEVFSQLAEVNCKLWHEPEKVYDFENVTSKEKNIVVNQLAVLNLERNKCIDEIDKNLLGTVKSINFI